MSRGYDFVEKIIKFLNKIDYKFKNEILLIIAGTNNDIISKIEEFIKKDYIDFYIKKHQKLRLNHKSAVKLNELKSDF